MTDDEQASPDAPPPADSVLAELIGEVAEVAARMIGGLNPLLEAAVGVRARCIAEGFDDESASRVAAEFYRATITILLRASASNAKPGGTAT